MDTPLVELLWWAGCPSTERALAELRGVMAALGLAAAEIKVSEVVSEEQAREREFRGSPTILIAGQDPFAGDGEEEVGLSCRVYRRRDGRVSPTPDPEDLRDALQEMRQ
jgi:hypothetical protein